MSFYIDSSPERPLKKGGRPDSRLLACTTRLTQYLLLPAVFMLLFAASSYAGDEPFTYASNWGGTGIMEIPTARTLKENTYRAGVSQVDPYRTFYMAVSPLEGLEVDGRIREFINIPFAEQGSAKDKVIDIKYQGIREGKYMPAIAVGIMDPHGTRQVPSQYIVASKQVYPFDFTLGFGNGRFGKRPLISTTKSIQVEMLTEPRAWLRDSQFFWGIQFAPSDKYALMFEYSPIEYHLQTSDRAQSEYFHAPVPSNFNFGIRYKLTDWAEADLSYQRGDQFGVNISMAFDMEKPLIPLYDRIYRETPSDIADTPSERIKRILSNSGFSDIGIAMDGKTMWLEAKNDKYYYTSRAIGIIVKVLKDTAPEYVDDIHIIIKENGIPVLEFTTTRADIKDLYAGTLTFGEFLLLSKLKTDIKDTLHAEGSYKRHFNYGIKPSFASFLNDPSGFFKYKFGARGWLQYYPWKGASFIAGLATYPLNNITTTNEPLSIPVRSDIVDYDEEEVLLDRLMYQHIKTLAPSVYGKISAGLLETQFAGADMEIAMPVMDGRFMLGISGSAVKKRAPDNPFELHENPAKDIFTTAFFNTRLNIPEKEIAIDIKAGQFLAGDKGARLTVSKHINGLTLWAWFATTDTSIFNDSFNSGYHDKGIGISIPLRTLKGADSRTVFNYVLSPWTRDVGQDIEHFTTLFDFIGRNTKIFLDKDRKYMYK